MKAIMRRKMIWSDLSVVWGMSTEGAIHSASMQIIQSRAAAM
jgi:hypothetical protein